MWLSWLRLSTCVLHRLPRVKLSCLHILDHSVSAEQPSHMAKLFSLMLAAQSIGWVDLRFNGLIRGSTPTVPRGH